MLVEENNYVNGKLDGVSKKYNEQYLTDEIHYKNGMREGLHRIYSEDGGVEDIYYEADKKTGESRKFSPTDRKGSVSLHALIITIYTKSDIIMMLLREDIRVR